MRVLPLSCSCRRFPRCRMSLRLLLCHLWYCSRVPPVLCAAGGRATCGAAACRAAGLSACVAPPGALLLTAVPPMAPPVAAPPVLPVAPAIAPPVAAPPVLLTVPPVLRSWPRQPVAPPVAAAPVAVFVRPLPHFRQRCSMSWRRPYWRRCLKPRQRRLAPRLPPCLVQHRQLQREYRLSSPGYHFPMSSQQQLPAPREVRNARRHKIVGWSC